MASQDPIRILALSDIHLEFSHLEPIPDLLPDLVLLAGDIGRGTDAIIWAEHYFPEVPVVFIIGNHESYRNSLELVLDYCRTRAAKTRNIHFLENDQVVLPLRGREIRILGTCLWTDFKLNGADYQHESMLIAQRFGRLPPHQVQRHALATVRHGCLPRGGGLVARPDSGRAA